MPACLPIVQKETSHALVSYLPMEDTVLADLLDDGFCHKKAGTYAEHPEADALLRFRQHCCPDY